MKYVFILFFAYSNSYAQAFHLYETENDSCTLHLKIKESLFRNNRYLEVQSSAGHNRYDLRECYAGQDQGICHYFSKTGKHLIKLVEDEEKHLFFILNNCYYFKK